MTTEPLSIAVVGLGPGDPGAVPARNLEILKGARRVFLRTARHPAVAAVREAGVAFETFDPLYERAATFEEVYEAIVDRLLAEAAAPGDGERTGYIAYAVTGNPLVGESSVALLRRRAAGQGLPVTVHGAPSFIDAVLQAAGLDPLAGGGVTVVDALQVDRLPPPRPGRVPVALVIAQVYDRLIAGRVKLWLMEELSAEHPVKVIRAAGIPGEERVEEVPLYELDRLSWVDYLTTVVVEVAGVEGGAGVAEVADEAGDKSPFDAFMEVVHRLRGEGGCPWDREQTHESLKPYAIEETYEVLDAIDKGRPKKFCEELGDLQLQIGLHSVIAEEEGWFTADDVLRGITEKMIRRHPHVFAGVKVKNSAEVLQRWGRIKQGEREAEAAAGEKAKAPSVLDGVPRQLPALLRAQRTQAKAQQVGFDWPDVKGALDKVSEELGEFVSAYGEKSQAKITEEIGDLLFAVVNVARFGGVDAETALAATADKFERRFRYVERKARAAGRSLTSMTIQEMDAWWDESKKQEKAGRLESVIPREGAR